MDIFHALADPNRRKIVELLASEGELSASEISERFSISPQAISQHLKVLRETGLLQMEKRAQQRIYTVNPQAMSQLEAWTRQLRQYWEQRFDAMEEVLQAEKKRLQAKSK